MPSRLITWTWSLAQCTDVGTQLSRGTLRVLLTGRSQRSGRFSFLSMKKLINRSKKEMERFIQAKLRIITWEQPFRKLREPSRLLEVQHSHVGF